MPGEDTSLSSSSDCEPPVEKSNQVSQHYPSEFVSLLPPLGVAVRHGQGGGGTVQVPCFDPARYTDFWFVCVIPRQPYIFLSSLTWYETRFACTMSTPAIHRNQQATQASAPLGFLSTAIAQQGESVRFGETGVGYPTHSSSFAPTHRSKGSKVGKSNKQKGAKSSQPMKEDIYAAQQVQLQAEAIWLSQTDMPANASWLYTHSNLSGLSLLPAAQTQ